VTWEQKAKSHVLCGLRRESNVSSQRFFKDRGSGMSMWQPHVIVDSACLGAMVVWVQHVTTCNSWSHLSTC
jgi:hypothetical protein